MGEKKSKKRSYLGNNDSGSSNKKQKLNKDQSDDDESTKKGLKISDNEKRLVNKIIQGAPSTNWKLLQTKILPKGSSKKTKNITQKSEKNESSEVWFDGVDEELLEGGSSNPKEKSKKKKEPSDPKELTKALAMDCEMVGVGEKGRESMLARVSLVNQHGACIYDEFVKPREKVTDYRTFVSGIRKSDFAAAKDFDTVQKEVYNLIKNRILVGHALDNDMKVLYLDHPKSKVRDTARYRPFKALFNGKTPSLKKLADKLLNMTIQTGEHSSVQDAQAVMAVYMTRRKKWETEIKLRKPVVAPLSKGRSSKKRLKMKRSKKRKDT